MADPGTLAMISMGGTVVGSLLSAFGKEQAGESSAKMYEYQAGIAEMNRKIALQNRDYERNVGEVQTQEFGMKARAQVAQTAAAQASSGLDINRGSAVAVRDSEVELAQHGEQIIRANAARRAYGYEVEATQDAAQAGLYKMAAAKSRQEGDIGALGSLLSGGTSVADKWLQGQSKGLFGSGNPTDVGSAITLG